MERGGNETGKKRGKRGSLRQLVLPLVSFIPHLQSVSVSNFGVAPERTASLWRNGCVGWLIDAEDEREERKA